MNSSVVKLIDMVCASYPQIRVESHCLKLLDYFYTRRSHRGSSSADTAEGRKRQPLLNREDTVDFLVRGLLRGISSGYQCLDASRWVAWVGVRSEEVKGV